MADPIPVHVPKETVSDQTVLVQSLSFANGERVEEGAIIAVLETSKAAVEVAAPVAGYVRYCVEAETEVEVGSLLAYLAESAAIALQDSPSATAIDSVPPRPDRAGTYVTTPVAVTTGTGGTSVIERRISAKASALIAEHRVDLGAFGNAAIIREADVRSVLGMAGVAVPPTNRPPDRIAAPSAAEAASVPAMNRVPYHSAAPSRRKQGERTVLSSGVPPTMLPSMVAVQRLTRGLKEAIAGHPTLHGNTLAVMLYETSRLLRRYPDFNAFYEGGRIHTYDAVHIGFAVDDGRGLLVPVVHDADRISLTDTVAEVERLFLLYDEGRLTEADLARGTFTISDLSQYRVPVFVPLISARQGAILGICSEFIPPGNAIGHQQLLMTFDHQIADGRQAACFLSDLGDRLTHYEDAFRPGKAESAGPPLVERFCATCTRSVADLRRVRGRLLKAVNEDGEETLICSICLAGN